MSQSAGLRADRQGPVVYLWLARPQARNALDEPLVLALTDAVLASAGNPEVRAIVLAGEGEVFCAGADIAEMQRLVAQGEAANRGQADRLAELLAAIHRCPKPVVARVQGAAYGGGVGLLAASDLVIASQEARFALTEVRLGIAAALIAPYVARRIGAARLCELALSGQPIDARKACEIGLVTEVTEADALDSVVTHWLHALLRGAPQAQAAVKRIADRVAGDPAALSPLLAAELACLRAMPEAQEGMAAFLQKRAPAWWPATMPTTESSERDRHGH